MLSNKTKKGDRNKNKINHSIIFFMKNKTNDKYSKFFHFNMKNEEYSKIMTEFCKIIKLY